MSITGVIPESDWQQPSKTKYCQYQDCGAVFGLFSSKTNCRRCGIVLCSKCVWQCKCITGHYNNKPQPVCPRCMEHIEKQKVKLARSFVPPKPPLVEQCGNDTVTLSMAAAKHEELNANGENVALLRKELDSERNARIAAQEQLQQQIQENEREKKKYESSITKLQNQLNEHTSRLEEITQQHKTQLPPPTETLQHTVEQNLLATNNDKNQPHNEQTDTGTTSGIKKNTTEETNTTPQLIVQSHEERGALLNEVRSQLDAMTRERDALQQGDEERGALLNEVRSRLDAMTRERDALQHVDAAVNAIDKTGSMVSGCSDEVMFKRPLEVIALGSSTDGPPSPSGNVVVSIEVLKEREMELERRMVNLRAKEQKLLMVARKLRERYDELERQERSIEVQTCASRSVSKGSLCVKSLSPIVDVSPADTDRFDARRDSSLPVAEELLQQQLLRATEAYRDVVYDHIVDNASDGVAVKMCSLRSVEGETAVEKTSRMLRELEQHFGGSSGNGGVEDSLCEPRDDHMTNASERTLAAFRRLEKAMKALS